MKRITVLFVVLLAAALLPFADVLAGSVSYKGVFDDANRSFDLANIDLKQAISEEEKGNDEDAKKYYASALALFKNAMEKYGSISFYSPDQSKPALSCASYRDYCAGLIAILEANDLEYEGYLKEAQEKLEDAYSRYFKPLSKAQFMDSENLVTYCTARFYQLKKMRQSAIDSFWELSGLNVLDSKKRHNDLINYVPLPTQAPDTSLPPFFAAYAAHATKAIDVYAGPNSKNAPCEKITLVKIEKDTFLRVCAREGDYDVAEIDTAQGKIRFWINDVRVLRDEVNNTSLPVIKCDGRSKMVYKDAKALYGPGEGYRNRNITIPKGTRVDVYNQEGSYTLVEYKYSTDSLIRVWIPSECLKR